MRALYCLLFVLLLCVPASAADALPDPGDIRAVRVAGPSWEGFTNKDGTGLYHEVLTTLFGLYGIDYIREYVPSERAYHMVRDNTADLMTCHDKAPKGLILAPTPMFEGEYHVFFNRANIGEWKLPDSMEGRSIAWRIGYYDQSNIPARMVTKELKSGVSALGMVILGRIDFYLDDVNFIQDSIRENPIPFNMDEFRIESIGSRRYSPVFNDTQRGLKIMDLYEKGMAHLYRSGRLQEIFAKWGFPLPHYDFE